MKLTAAEENYILAIHRLSNGERVSTNQLAQEIGIAAASVTDMIQKLAEKEYVRYEKYKGVSLLPTGVRIAKKIHNTKSLWQDFLQNHLQLSHTETSLLLEQLQHVQSPHFAEQFKAYLMSQLTTSTSALPPQATQTMQADLFSAPPPIAEQVIEKKEPLKELSPPQETNPTQNKILSECKMGQTVYLIGLHHEFKTAEDLLNFQQLPLGVKLTVKNIHQFDQSMVISNNQHHYLISNDLAKLIFIAEQ